MRTRIPNERSNVLRIWCYLFPHLVYGFLDVHRSDDVDHQQPHVCLGECFPWTDSSTEPKDGVNLVGSLRIHLSYEPLGIELIWLWIELFVPGDCPRSQSAAGRPANEMPQTTR